MLRPQGFPARPTGGGQISAVQIAVALHELGVRVCMAESEPSILYSYARVLEAYTLGANRHFLDDTIGIAKTVWRTKCDSIYAFSDFFPETVVPCSLAALMTRKKLFVNVTSTAYEFEDRQRFLGLIRRRWRRMLRTPGRVRAIGPLLSFTFFHAARRLVFRTGSCVVKNHFMESYTKSRLHARRAFVVGAGVEEFWYERAGGERSFDCVCSVVSFDQSKRVSTLVRAWQIVVKKKPDARLLLIGESEGEEFPMVKRLANDFGLSSNVVFAGFINDRRVLADRVGSAKVFVFPSVREGFGLVVAEAMAAGLPCVLSDVEPFREVFGEAALLVRADDPSAFADAILGLLLDERKRLEYSARSKSLARTFSWNAVGKKVLAALSEE